MTLSRQNIKSAMGDVSLIALLYRCAQRILQFWIFSEWSSIMQAPCNTKFIDNFCKYRPVRPWIASCAARIFGQNAGGLIHLIIIMCPQTDILYDFLSGTSRRKRYFHPVYFYEDIEIFFGWTRWWKLSKLDRSEGFGIKLKCLNHFFVVVCNGKAH